MPGGRGTFEQIAISLNTDHHKEVAKVLKDSIDCGEYTIQASVILINNGIRRCSHRKTLRKVFRRAMMKKRVDWDY